MKLNDMRRIPDAKSRPMDMADMPSRGTAPARGMGFILTHLISPCKPHQRFS